MCIRAHTMRQCWVAHEDVWASYSLSWRRRRRLVESREVGTGGGHLTTTGSRHC